ncbi:hypothetical protein BGZ63DRAFT_98514 [Mariannaea sp. PMI_226]|nr:hypothetical protein BGZ63DRAFT_98514 [Mariannaea sp. PMI_226]
MALHKLHRWLHVKLDKLRHQTQNETLAAEPRAAPAPRQHVSLGDQQNGRDGHLHSAFFHKLPPELRRKVLVQAFGGIIVHMDLEFDHPLASAQSKSIKEVKKFYKRSYRYKGTHGVPHANRYCHVERGRITRNLIRDNKKPKSWHWSGCRCHRETEGYARGGQDLKNSAFLPWYDLCLAGYADMCEEVPGLMPGKCFLGALGWLLSCHMAYIEGIEVLYGTNTLHLSRPILLRQMTELFLPQRLHSIQSIELIWNVDQWKSRGTELEVSLSPARDVVAELVRIVPDAFPNLQKARIGLVGCYYLGGDPNVLARAAEADILLPIDDMVRKLPLLRDMYLGLPNSVVQLRLEAGYAMGIKGDWYLGPRYDFHRVWRSVAPAVNPSSDNPNSLDDLNATGADTMGYWLTTSEEDIYLPEKYLTPCFGTKLDELAWRPTFAPDTQVGEVIPGSTISWVNRRPSQILV